MQHNLTLVTRLTNPFAPYRMYFFIISDWTGPDGKVWCGSKKSPLSKGDLEGYKNYSTPNINIAK